MCDLLVAGAQISKCRVAQDVNGILQASKREKVHPKHTVEREHVKSGVNKQGSLERGLEHATHVSIGGSLDR